MRKRLSVQDFKNWLANQNDMAEFFNIAREEHNPDEEKYVGCHARPKVSKRKLIETIECDEDDVEALLEEFKENGGYVAAVHGRHLQIETDMGTFQVPRFCVKLRREQ